MKAAEKRHISLLYTEKLCAIIDKDYDVAHLKTYDLWLELLTEGIVKPNFEPYKGAVVINGYDFCLLLFKLGLKYYCETGKNETDMVIHIREESYKDMFNFIERLCKD